MADTDPLLNEIIWSRSPDEKGLLQLNKKGRVSYLEISLNPRALVTLILSVVRYEIGFISHRESGCLSVQLLASLDLPLRLNSSFNHSFCCSPSWWTEVCLFILRDSYNKPTTSTTREERKRWTRYSKRMVIKWRRENVTVGNTNYFVSREVLIKDWADIALIVSLFLFLV